MNRGACFHCGEPLPAGRLPQVRVDDRDQEVCCQGCAQAAQWIQSAGLADYYRLREAPAERVSEAFDLSAWDDPALHSQYVHRHAEDRAEISLLVEGLRCAACAWLIEHALGAEPGVREARINFASQRLRLAWDPQRVPLSVLLERLLRLGYRPHPASGEQRERMARSERRRAQRRLLVAGFGMMQAMMYGVALYAGAFEGMEDSVRDFFRWLGFLVVTPVIAYSGQPFFLGAWRSLKNRILGMDLPVALALSLAYLASLVEILRGGPEVYFDSVAMFVFLLSLARYVELRARQRGANAIDALARLTPAVARRVEDGVETLVPVQVLRPGDQVRVLPGEALPADGALIDDRAELDEALLSGESRPLLKRAGEAVHAGSLCLGRSLLFTVQRTGAATLVAHTTRLVERALSERPRMAQLAERAAGRFIARVLIFAAITASLWLWIEPERAFSITLAVLVVACPCALSLAVPTAVAAALTRLAAHGVLVIDSDAVERLAAADRVIFDKTGTLSRGRMTLEGVTLLGDRSETEVLALAAGMERHSNHPLAQAFAGHPDPALVEDCRSEPGLGLEARWQGRRLRLGRADFALDAAAEQPDGLILSLDGLPLAAFAVSDSLRPEAAAVVAGLAQRGLRPLLLSGDAEVAVRETARLLNLPDWRARQRPEDKLAELQRLQAAGHRVLMVGDGINDAPVLAGADVSVALAEGAEVAKASAQLVLSPDRLGQLPETIDFARRARRTMRQNLTWALVYNFSAVPFAAMGWVPPWLAAIGMSLSSLVVTLNAARLAHWQAPSPTPRQSARPHTEASRDSAQEVLP